MLEKEILQIDFSGTEGKVKLNVSLTLESILDLDEVKSLMKLQIQVSVNWMDSRLEFINVDKELNTINMLQKKSLWMPNLIFDNTNDKTEVAFDDESSNGMILITPKAKSKTAPLTVLHNYKKYAGTEG